MADLVFTTPSGQPIHADKLATKFKAILQKADLPMMRLYDLDTPPPRLALAAGVPPKVVSEQLGACLRCIHSRHLLARAAAHAGAGSDEGGRASPRA
jgi:hypothetical protein